jgi:hypothetical protein
MYQHRWGWQDQWDRQRGLCWICLKSMRPYEPEQRPHPENASEDHIVPLARGGANRWSNKLLAHVSCNNDRDAPFVWVKLSVFRRAALARLDGLSSEVGVDLCSTIPNRKHTDDTLIAVGRATGPTKWPAEGGLRGSLADLSHRSLWDY